MSVARAPWVDGLTIGEMLRETALRLGDREAIVFPRLKPDETPREQGGAGECFRLSFRELNERVDQVARALLALGLQKGRARGGLGDELAPVGAVAICDRADRGGAGHDQPGLPQSGTGVCPQAVRCERAVSGG